MCRRVMRCVRACRHHVQLQPAVVSSEFVRESGAVDLVSRSVRIAVVRIAVRPWHASCSATTS